MSDDHNQASTDDRRFRGAIDDVIIIPLVSVALVVNKILRFIFSMVMRLLDYAFPFAMQVVWLPACDQGHGRCHRQHDRRRAAPPSIVRNETSAVAYVSPPELVAVAAEDQLSRVRAGRA